MSDFWKGDIGVTIRVRIVDENGAAVDVSGSTNRVIKYRKPDKSTGQWNASIYGSNYLEYTTTLASDLDQAGRWQAQAYYEKDGWKGHVDPISFIVKEHV